MSIRPMLAVEGVSEVDLAAKGVKNLIQFPCAAEVKFDGFRCIMVNGTPMTRTLKPIRNVYVRNALESVFGTEGYSHRKQFVDDPDHPLSGLDGELIALDPENLSELKLHKTQSFINSASGSPRFVYHVFDDFSKPSLPYEVRKQNTNARLKRIRNHVSAAKLEDNPERLSKRIHDHVFQSVPYKICERIEDILEFEAECLEWGAEGIMLKSLTEKYKFGRSTMKQFACVKVKRFTDSEARIIGFVEKMHNDNAAELDERGYTKRTSHKENKRPANTLGAIELDWNGIEFQIGTGWDAETAKEIWDNRNTYFGAKVNFKYKEVGPNGKPLIPSFQALRFDI